MIRAVCSLIAVALATYSLALDKDMYTSPCPSVFKYIAQVENQKPLAKRWYGVVKLFTNVTLHALYLNIILDKKADILGSWLGEVTTKDNIDFIIENHNITVVPKQHKTIFFFVQYSSDFKPNLNAIFLNGIELCNAKKTVVVNATSVLIDGNNKTRVKSANRSGAKNKNIQTTSSKAKINIERKINRTQTNKNMQSTQAANRSEIHLLYLKKSENNQQPILRKEGNFACVSCNSKGNNGSITLNNNIKAAPVIEQKDKKDKKSQHLQINSNQRFDILQKADNTNKTTNISTSGKMKVEEKSKTDNDGRFGSSQRADNSSKASNISTSSTAKNYAISKIDNIQRFDSLQTAETKTIVFATSRTTKVDERSKIDNNRTFDKLQTIENTQKPTVISNLRTLKGENMAKIYNNGRLDSVPIAENAFVTTNISTSSKLKGGDIRNTDNNTNVERAQTAQNSYTSTDILTSRMMESNNRSKIDNNPRFFSLQTSGNPDLTTDISTTKNIKIVNRSKTDNDGRFDTWQTTEHAYITTDIAVSKNITVNDRSKTELYSDSEVEDSLGKLEVVGDIAVEEISGEPQIYSTSGTTSWSHPQSVSRDVFRGPTLSNPDEEINVFKDFWTVMPQLPAETEDEEDDVHNDDYSHVYHPVFNPEPSCGRVIKTRPRHLPYGSTTSEGQWPWQVAIYQQRTVDLKYICGGTLVSERHVITAAHCVTKKKTRGLVHTQTLTIYLGKFNLRLSVDGVQVKFVNAMAVHPEYNSTNYSHDLAILELLGPAMITDWVRPVCLWPEEETSLSTVIGQAGSVVGWSFEESGLTNAELRLTEMTVVDHETCINSFDSFYNALASKYTYCARYKKGTETCNGNDSGGGMVFKKGNSWYLRGIVSVSIAYQNEKRCDSKHYIIFTDVAKLLLWIRDYVDL